MVRMGAFVFLKFTKIINHLIDLAAACLIAVTPNPPDP